MIPINRKIDGEVAGVKNNDSFEACYKLLEEGKTLVIFPEGNFTPSTTATGASITNGSWSNVDGTNLIQ